MKQLEAQADVDNPGSGSSLPSWHLLQHKAGALAGGVLFRGSGARPPRGRKISAGDRQPEL